MRDYKIIERMDSIEVDPNFELEGPLATHLRKYDLPVDAQSIVERAKKLMTMGGTYGLEYDGTGVHVTFPVFGHPIVQEIRVSGRDIIEAYARGFIKVEELARIAHAGFRAMKLMEDEIRREYLSIYGDEGDANV